MIAQPYDGESNVQGHSSGVQKILRDDCTPFGMQLHCLNYQVQITVKNNKKGHNLITRITDIFFCYCEDNQMFTKKNSYVGED